MTPVALTQAKRYCTFCTVPNTSAAAHLLLLPVVIISHPPPPGRPIPSSPSSRENQFFFASSALASDPSTHLLHSSPFPLFPRPALSLLHPHPHPRNLTLSLPQSCQRRILIFSIPDQNSTTAKFAFVSSTSGIPVLAHFEFFLLSREQRHPSSTVAVQKLCLLASQPARPFFSVCVWLPPRRATTYPPKNQQAVQPLQRSAASKQRQLDDTMITHLHRRYPPVHRSILKSSSSTLDINHQSIRLVAYFSCY